jgi:hypothetical protein
MSAPTPSVTIEVMPPKKVSVGEALVSSSLVDRVVSDVGRRLRTNWCRAEAGKGCRRSGSPARDLPYGCRCRSRRGKDHRPASRPASAFTCGCRGAQSNLWASAGDAGLALTLAGLLFQSPRRRPHYRRRRPGSIFCDGPAASWLSGNLRSGCERRPLLNLQPT